jgi:formylglycine-generating enzyme required for sulfatase activity
MRWRPSLIRITPLALVVVLAGREAWGLECQDTAKAPPAAAQPAAPAAKPPEQSKPETPKPPALAAFPQDVPGAAFKFDMVPVPGSPDGKIKPFYIGKTELTWEAFDAFVFALDEEEGGTGASPAQTKPGGASTGGTPVPSKQPDAITRPTKPYLPPDRGFGHEGYAAISLSCENAKAFCVWLSAKSGRKYRLPTVAEWQLACAGSAAPTSGAAGDPAHPAAWLAGNSGGVPHPVATSTPNALGIFDMRGNVMEWCLNEKGEGVACGGSYRDETATCTTVAPFDPEWNSSDPQVPKSKWWLADGPFVGFRVVCEP